MTDRWDETWHRLREWTNGQAQSERLAAQILSHENFKEIDPSHPLGGKDGGKDAVCRRNGQNWIMAVYFPRGQQEFTDIKKKFCGDFKGVAGNNAEGFAFVTNQELRLAERQELKEEAVPVPIELYHLERITLILDKPAMAGVRKQFLLIDIPEKIPLDEVEKKRIWVGCSVASALSTEDEVRSSLNPVVMPISNGEVNCKTKRSDSLPEGTGVYHYVVAEGLPSACVGVNILGNLEEIGKVVIDQESYSIFRSEYSFCGKDAIIWKLIYLAVDEEPEQ